MNLHIRGGEIIDPARKVARSGSLYLGKGRIAGLFRAPPGFRADRIIDARGLLVLPGLVDLSVRLHGHGLALESSLPCELKAASRGGVTSLCCPPDSEPVIDRPAVVEAVLQRCRKLGRADVHCIGALTRGLAGEQLAEMAALKKAGCIALGNAHAPMDNARILRHCMEYAHSCEAPVMLFAEDANLANRGVLHEGVISTRLGLPAVPETAETVALSRAILLAEQTGVRLHICRLSAGRSVSLLKRAQKQGLPITADAAIAQLLMTEEHARDFDSNHHLRPPLRTARDRAALLRGLREGVIAAICSDHQPHGADAKARPFSLTRPGASTVESLLALAMRLVERGKLPRDTAIAALSCRPAEVLGLEHGGALAPGAPANLCLFDPRRADVIQARQLHSQGKNTPFQDWSVPGQVVMTIYRGRIVHAA